MNVEIVIFNFLRSFQEVAILNWTGVFFALYLPYVLLIAFFIFAFWNRAWKLRMEILLKSALVVLLSSGVFVKIIQFFYDRPRPFTTLAFDPLIESSPASFPSDHAAFFFALALVVWHFNRKWGWWFIGTASLIGIARTFLGIHWFSDILGGLLVALIAYFVVKKIFETKKPALPKEPEVLPPLELNKEA